jgi:hypothetical protein
MTLKHAPKVRLHFEEQPESIYRFYFLACLLSLYADLAAVPSLEI